MASMLSPMILELALIALSALCFWLLDRYVIGLEKV
jgi:hypothetical protein